MISLYYGEEKLFLQMMEDRSRLILRKVFSIMEKSLKRSLKNERARILNIHILIAYLNK